MYAAQLLLEADRRCARIHKRLLSAEEEVGLSLLFRGDRPPAEPLHSGFRADLADGSEAARAFEALILHNQRLVWAAARQQLHIDFELDDLVQSGFNGLIRAAELFDPSSGNKFSTYAMWWLRQSMSHAIANEGRSIRTTVHIHERVRKVMNLCAQILVRDGGVRLNNLATQAELTLEQTAECLCLGTRAISLDAPIGGGKETPSDRTQGEQRCCPGAVVRAREKGDPRRVSVTEQRVSGTPCPQF